MVFRYIIVQTKGWFFKYHTKFHWQPNRNVPIFVQFNWPDKNNDIITRSVIIDGKTCGKTTRISFNEWVKDRFKIPGIMYLFYFLQQKFVDTIDKKKTYEYDNIPKQDRVTAGFLWNQFHHKKSHKSDLEEVYDTSYSNVRVYEFRRSIEGTLQEVLDRGYYKKDDKGRIFIGSDLCDHCQDEMATLKLGCCQQVAYCSEECAQKGWVEKHKKECDGGLLKSFDD